MSYVIRQYLPGRVIRMLADLPDGASALESGSGVSGNHLPEMIPGVVYRRTGCAAGTGRKSATPCTRSGTVVQG